MYFLTIPASLSLSTIVPRAVRTNFAVRLIMPWRLPWAWAFTLPVPVILKRFFAPLLVFNLGILLELLYLLGAHACAVCADPPRKQRSGASTAMLLLVGRLAPHPRGCGPNCCLSIKSRHGMPRRAARRIL